MTVPIWHRDPVWEKRASFLFHARLADLGPESREQLWGKLERPGVVRLCCIPFLVYGMALDDVVTVDEENILGSVASRSGRGVLRIAAVDLVALVGVVQIASTLREDGLLVEVTPGGDLAAIDVPDVVTQSSLTERLKVVCAAGDIDWEMGAEATAAR